MSRATPSAVTTPFRTEKPEPVWLVDLETGGSPANVRLAGYDGDVVLGGYTFSARPVQVGELGMPNQGEAPTVELRIGDADGYFQSTLPTITWGNRRVRVYRTDRTAIGASSAITDALRDDFFVEGFSRVHGWAVFRLQSMVRAFDIELPRRTVTRQEYPGMPPSGNVL